MDKSNTEFKSMLHDVKDVLLDTRQLCVALLELKSQALTDIEKKVEHLVDIAQKMDKEREIRDLKRVEQEEKLSSVTINALHDTIKKVYY